MPAISNFSLPLAAAKGVQQTLKLARAANPRHSLDSAGFDSHLSSVLSSTDSKPIAETGRGRMSPAVPAASGSLEPGLLSSGDLRADYTRAAAEFETQFRSRASELGIDLSDGLMLQADERGEVKVIGDHPDKQAIEQLFRDDPRLRGLFQTVESRALSMRREQARSMEINSLYSPLDIRSDDFDSSDRFALFVNPEGVRAHFMPRAD